MAAKRQWIVLTALACAVVLVAGFMLLVRPQHSKAASIKTQTSSVQSQISSLRAQLAQLREESRNLAGQQAQLARIQQQLPSDPQEPTLLRKIDAAASSADVELVNVAPGNPAPYSTPTAGSTTGTPVAGLAVIPVVLTVSGGYFQMERFLDSLEGLQRSMLVTSFSLVTNKAVASTSGLAAVGAGEISATINTQVFMSTAAAGTTAAPSGTAATSGSAATARATGSTSTAS